MLCGNHLKMFISSFKVCLSFNASCNTMSVGFTLDIVFEKWRRQYSSNRVRFHHWSCQLVNKAGKRSNPVLWVSWMQEIEKLGNSTIHDLVTKAFYFSGGTERGQTNTRWEHKWAQVIIHLPRLRKKIQHDNNTKEILFYYGALTCTRVTYGDQKPKARWDSI